MFMSMFAGKRGKRAARPRTEPVQFQVRVFFGRDRKPALPRRRHDAQTRFRNNG